LKRTIGLLSNPEVAVVQTPQFYYNPESDPAQSAGPRKLGRRPTLSFFDIFQPAKDAWDAHLRWGRRLSFGRDRFGEIGDFRNQAISEDK